MRIMIVGAGMVGYHLSEKLSGEGQEVVLIDQDDNKLRRIERDLNVLPVLGSGASARVLEEAGIDKTDLFIAVTDSDEVNLISCIISKQYNVKTRIARVRNEDFYAQGTAQAERALGIDLLISPDLAITEEIMRLITMSQAFEVAEFARGRIELLGYNAQAGQPCVGKSLQDLRDLQGIYDFVIVAISRNNKTIIPRGKDRIEVGDKVYLVMRKKDVPPVENLLFNAASHAPKNAFIVGGGTIGYLVARQMEQKKINVRLVEQNSKRCEFLAEQLEHTVVLNSNGLEAHDLLDEGIDQADLVISVTNSDTTNILSSLLAKHHGAKKCITHITNPGFIPMLGKLGIDVPLSPRQVAANMILRFVRGGGKIVNITTLQGSDAEVIEMKIPNNDKFADLPLKYLEFPMGAIIGAIMRGGEIIIPTGDTLLQPNDNLVVFFTKDALQAVENLFGE
ncbi:MAG: Trk system potassium transporter TrkA [Desulfobulbaceae bacterium]|nr:Trk system potassium transporter TrkA [Desulfobulbaceae bacterium]HIJ78440.1 Trk system potassium transporter TrkA [Deltaproteobacteria bacterium]